MSNIIELFGKGVASEQDWASVVAGQQCPFLGKRCYKVRKSNPEISIGTCSVMYGRDPSPVLICPTRLLERNQIFIDCIHLLTTHDVGNELHVVSEVGIPGGNVDFFLVSVRDGKVRDFVGIELQTLDTTGTVWPERQRAIIELGLHPADDAAESNRPFGMNWKMTAKTILVQMHHKVTTFEHVNKKLVLVVQDKLLNYMKTEFKFDHLHDPALIGDAMHLHAYSFAKREDQTFGMSLASRLSTDADGIGQCLGLQAEAKIELEAIVSVLESKIGPSTRLQLL